MTSPTAPAPLDLKNVQGDVLAGLPKKTQTYFFFQIIAAKVKEFREHLTHLLPLITTTAQVLHDQHKIANAKKHGNGLLKLSGVNIVFSRKGFTVLGINDKLGDDAFDDNGGMLARAKDLGDPGTTTGTTFTPNWIPGFKKDIHGLILVSGECHQTVAEELQKIEHIFKLGRPDASIQQVIKIVGDVRPGKEAGHEHFGFLDGISQPAVAGVDTKPNPGQETVPQGIILMGRDSDPVTTRPSWALDGSLLAFRYLPQLVPEFDTFLTQNPLPIPGLTPAQGSELLGARLVGRWKSGAPIDVFPDKDHPAAGVDPAQNNNFRYDFPNDQQTQDRCPFAAHTRKTNPRADLEDHVAPNGPLPAPPPNESATSTRRILRRGIQFGPEMSEAEKASGRTEHERGLLFAAYQSVIPNGFEFIQKSWANATNFPPFKTSVPNPGFDPLIGQALGNTDGVRTLEGTDPNQPNKSLSLPTEWVVPKGGEYFFSPSIPALKTKFALPVPSSTGPSDEL